MKAEATIAYSARPRLAPLTMAHTTIKMGMNDINPKASANLRSKRSSFRDRTVGPRDARGGMATSGFIASRSIPDARGGLQSSTQDYADLSATERVGVNGQRAAINSQKDWRRKTANTLTGILADDLLLTADCLLLIKRFPCVRARLRGAGSGASWRGRRRIPRARRRFG